MRWGDKLTSYNGVGITYDEMGNPLTYFNGKMYAFTWENGRQLATAYPGGNYNLSFEYNDEGIRTRKTVSGVVHDYILNGSQIVGEKIGSNLVLYLYDAEGMPIGMQYRKSSYAEGVFDTYWFEKNLQGDIVAVYSETGTKLITYTYDAWGNCTTTYHNGGASTTATYNPFRYRGYYLDTETGFYYLNSRYYDPVIGRFISPDNVALLGANGDFASYNLYAYCGNNPVIRKDNSGYCWNILGGAVIGAVIGVTSQAISNLIEGKSITNELGKAAITGAVGGALTAAFPGASTLINAGMSATESVISDIQNGENIPTILVNATLSAGFAAVTSGGTVFSDKNIVTNTFKAIGQTLPGNHPNVKNAATNFLQKTGKAVLNEIKTGVMDGLFVGYVDKATQWYSGLYTGSKNTYNSFAH